MTDPLRDHIRAALDYDVIIRDALYGVPNSAINDLVERLAEGMAAPKPKRDPLTDPQPKKPAAKNCAYCYAPVADCWCDELFDDGQHGASS